MAQNLDIKCDRCGDFAVIIGEVNDVLKGTGVRRMFRCGGCDTVHWRRKDDGARPQEPSKDKSLVR